MNKIGKKFYTPLTEFRPELQPNGRIVECTGDLGDGYLLVSSNENFWVTNIKNLKEIHE